MAVLFLSVMYMINTQECCSIGNRSMRPFQVHTVISVIAADTCGCLFWISYCPQLLSLLRHSVDHCFVLGLCDDQTLTNVLRGMSSWRLCTIFNVRVGRSIKNMMTSWWYKFPPAYGCSTLHSYYLV